jgi:hypothetical protein
MSTTLADTEETKAFHHSPPDTEDCNCPIHRNRTHRPFTAPLGMGFADQVSVEPIRRSAAVDVYNCHHSYMDGDSLHPASDWHHGIYYRDQLLGAITYGYSLASRKNLYFDDDGKLLPEPLSKTDIRRDLPEQYHSRAFELFDLIDEEEIAECRTVVGNKIVSAERICLAEQMPNLASAGLARSQEAFYRSHDCPTEAEYLSTYVLADFPGSMIRALRDKGWRLVSYTEGKPPSNRQTYEIHHRPKWCFICPIEQIVEQCTLSEW